MKISCYEAADVFLQHKGEILKAVRMAAPGRRVMAAVAGDGSWLGAVEIDLKTLNEMAQREEGYTFYMNADPYASREEIRDLIWDWEDSYATCDQAKHNSRKNREQR